MNNTMHIRIFIDRFLIYNKVLYVTIFITYITFELKVYLVLNKIVFFV